MIDDDIAVSRTVTEPLALTKGDRVILEDRIARLTAVTWFALGLAIAALAVAVAALRA